MEPDATLILEQIAAELADLYPTIEVKIRKRESANGKQLFGGWTEGFPLPCLVVSEGTPEPIDKYGSFEEISVGYPVLVEYVKATAANVPGSATPTEGAEDQDIREKRQQIRQRLYKPALAPLPFIVDVDMISKPPYDIGASKNAVVSGQIYRFETWEVRPSE